MNQQSITFKALFSDSGWRSNTIFVLSLAVAFSLPFPYIIFNSILIILMGIVWLFDRHILAKLKHTFTNTLFLLFAGVYFVQVAGMLYTNNVSTGLVFLEHKLSLLVFPLILSSAPLKNNLKAHLIALSFALACLIRSLLSCVAVLVPYLLGHRTTFPDMGELTAYLQINHPYFGMYLVASIIFILYFLINYWASLPVGFKVMASAFCVFLYMYLFLIGARTAMYTSFLLIMLHVVFYIRQSRQYKVGLVGMLGAIGMIVLIIGLNSSVKERLLSVFTPSLPHNPLYIRTIQWQCSLDILATTPVLGVGTGDVQPYLQQCYEENKFWGHLYKYNAHNDYLEEALRHGLIGLSLYLASLFYPLYLSLKQKKYLYSSFLLLFICCCTTESMLNTQKGAVYFSFFNSLFAFHLLKSKDMAADKA